MWDASSCSAITKLGFPTLFMPPYFEYLNDHHFLALIHTWGKRKFNGSDEVGLMAEKYPNATFACGHSFYNNFEYAPERLTGLDNVYYKLTGSVHPAGAFCCKIVIMFRKIIILLFTGCYVRVAVYLLKENFKF